MDDSKLSLLRDLDVPPPSADAAERAREAAMAAFREARHDSAAQGSGLGRRLKSIFVPPTWRWTMQRRLAVGGAAASFAAIAIAAQLTLGPREAPAPAPGGIVVNERLAPPAPQPASRADAATDAGSLAAAKHAPERTQEADRLVVAEAEQREPTPAPQAAVPPPQGAAPPFAANLRQSLTAGGAARSVVAQAPSSVAEPPIEPAYSGRDRFAAFDTNPLRTVAEHPVSTFSIDVDTASYAFVRRMLNAGELPPRDAVRVEEMINYFPYDYPRPDSAQEPFRTTVAVYPTPWNPGTKLLHIGIKGYDIAPAAKPRSNLVFLIDVSGSMASPDKLGLLKSAFRLLLDGLAPDDTVAIVTYAGAAGTALEPTRVAEKGKIVAAIDKLGAGGSTAGAAGIEAAYALAEQGFVKGGVNRVLLATDGDFNVGLSDPRQLEDFIAAKRASGVFLSVLGFGIGNYNDQLMQVLAQKGNGVAAYIDTLAEARKVLVDEAASTLFPIAKDVKIQIEFNPARVAEYRLIGYETRALARQDFNNDRVDAGDIGSGHSVTAIYEITPVGSPARLVDDLRYRREGSAGAGAAAQGDEYAFLRLRYKLPDADSSTLVTMPVTAADERAEIAAASDDTRFATAVAAFGQKLRHTSFVADYGYDKIGALAAGARGADPFGYRGEFLTLVRLAQSLDDAAR